MLPYIATYLYTRRGNKEESIKNARNYEKKNRKRKEKNENKERRIKERRKDTFF